VSGVDRAARSADAPSPLAGIKVLDWTRLLPGPFATMVLGDLGAQVDKLEDLQGADYLRHIPPLIGDTSSIFLALNRNKRSACLDLKKASGRDAFLALVRSYDVLVEQFRPGVLERLGVSHAKLLEANPRLVVCALTGYGQTGPLAKRAGHDLNYLARAGVLGFQGPTNGPPAVPGVQMADVGGGLWSVIGVLSALAEREKTGRGQVVDVAMVEASMPFAIASFGLGFGGTPARRGDEPLIGGIAPYNTYATKDGRAVALAALEPKFWMAFCAGVGIEPKLEALVPGAHQAAIKESLQAIFLGKTRDEWAAFGAQHDCCLEPVLEPGEVAGDAHLAAREMFFTMDSPWGAIPQMRTPLTPPGAKHAPPPRTGEHTEAILREAGIQPDAIAKLRAEGAIA
jgi:crotonobetainyl-CoA:carnitine CoA-transferase CaiB-like acyl-CoA transferase